MTKPTEINKSTSIGRMLAALLAGTLMLSQPVSATDDVRPMRFEQLTQEEGLSQNTVLSIHQDSKGFMWFGTENGLNRYDGFTFEYYKRDPQNLGSLVNDFVFDMAEDAMGDLWIATDGGGLAKWKRRTDSFTVYRNVPNDANSLAGNSVRALTIDTAGIVWVGHQRHGLDRLDPATGNVTHFRHSPENTSTLSSDEVYALHVDRNGEVWVGTNAGLNRLNSTTGQFVRYTHSADDPASLSNDRVRVVYEDRSGTLWVGTKGGGLNRYDRRTDSFTRFLNDADDKTTLTHDRVWSVLEDSFGRLWVATSGGLSLMDRPTGTFVRYTHDETDADSLGDNDVRSLYQDRGGILWVGTDGGGVHKWNPRAWAMGHTKTVSNGASHVMAFAEGDDGTLWIGNFDGGLTAVNRQTGESTHYGAGDKSLSDSRVMSLMMDADGYLWVGTMTGGLNRLDPRNGDIEVFRHDPEDAGSLSADGIMSLFQDRDGRIWVGTFGGGVSRLAGNHGFDRFVYDPNNSGGLTSPRATAFAQDDSGAVWVGTDGGGLNRWNPSTGVFDHFRHDPTNPAGLSADTVFDLHIDREGTLWIATRGGGLDKVMTSPQMPGKVLFKNVSQADGLPNDVIYGIESDDQGNLWLSTNYGLSRYNPRTGDVKNFHRSHGLQSEEFNFGAHYRTRAGELLFGGPNGFNAFFPRDLEQSNEPPDVVLTSFEKLNAPAVTDVPYGLLKNVSLEYWDDIVTFEFAALDYAAPGENRYEYMLDGFDGDWVDAGNRHRVTYTNLDRGDYVFRVRAANSDGVWSSEELTVNVSVAPAPWETVWAYALYALAGLMMLAAVWLVQQRRLKRRAEYSEVLETQVQERTQELANRNAELKVLNNRLAEASLTDPLTGLRNRRYLYEEASRDVDLIRRKYEDVIRGSNRVHTTDLVFLMIDLDEFKAINDTHGHAAGDEVLLEIRDTLRHACRSSDLIIRWGGDEFLVIARHTDAEQAAELAERIRNHVADKIVVLNNGQVVRVTCSVGFACFPFMRSDPAQFAWEQVLAVADRAMYIAKEVRDAWVGVVENERSGEVEALFETIQEDPIKLAEKGLVALLQSDSAAMAANA